MATGAVGLPHYELDGAGTTISYRRVGLGFPPEEGPVEWWEFHYHDGQHDLTFRSEQIGVLQTPIGELVTVTIERIPDLHEVTFTVVLPEIDRDGGAVSFETIAIRTTQRTPIGGPATVDGALQVYETSTLHGTFRLDPLPL
jgi:hypothetical protein